MSLIETRDELLNDTLKGAVVDRASEFLMSCTCSTQALRALVAAMCELDQVREAAVLEGVLPTIATIEAESI